jgi:N-acetylglutamate synthase-like GNAT family acetyltransferase
MREATRDDIEKITDMLADLGFAHLLVDANQKLERALRIENDHERERRMIGAIASYQALESLSRTSAELITARRKNTDARKPPSGSNRPVLRPRDRSSK